jgi:DNA-binding response OmpR family regulator
MSHRLKIYVIDDTTELCLDLRSWLNQADHEVTCSPAGRTLIHTLVEYQPNLIVLAMARYAGDLPEAQQSSSIAQGADDSCQ